MESITLQRVLPCVFAGEAAPRDSGVWSQEVTFRKGEYCLLEAASGTGKTSLCHFLYGIREDYTGKILFDGADCRGFSAAAWSGLRRRSLSMLFQNLRLFGELTVAENIGLKNELTHFKTQEQIGRMLEAAGIADKRDAPVEKLSFGQQQRVAIARAIVSEPEVLLLDEPLSNLDAKLRLEMRSELQRLHIDTGSTFIYVTHDQMEAMTLATKICLIDNGVLQQYDAPLDVYNKPNNLFVADFVGNPAINFMEAKGHQAPDGTVELEVFAGTRLAFTPRTPLDLPDWFARADAQDAEKKAAEQAKQSQKGHVEKGNKDTPFRCHIAKVNETEDFGDEAVLSDEDFVLGVRPEFLSISEHGALEAEVYSAMPTGMETTVKLRIGEYLLTGVIFGGVLYQIGQKVRVDFEGDHMVLFSRKNGRIITQGSLSVRSAR